MKWRTADRHIGVSTEQIRSSGLKPLWVCDAIARCARKTVAEAIAEALVTILEVLGSAGSLGFTVGTEIADRILNAINNDLHVVTLNGLSQRSSQQDMHNCGE